jgi:hypothetical protein
MDLKVFYQKLRQTESSIAEPYVVMVSQETPEGGRAGVRTEVSRGLAAKMLVEGRARMASAEEASEFREQTAEAKRLADQMSAANRMQITVVSEAELRTLKSALRPSRS